MATNAEIVAALSKLRHPGQFTSIHGVTVKREALRFRIAGNHFAYDLNEAAKLIEDNRCTCRDMDGFAGCPVHI